MYKTIELKREGRQARLTLNRPDSMNAMDGVMMKELADVFEELKSDTNIQVVLIRGEGRFFSAGGDIKSMLDPDNPMDIKEVMVDVSRLAKALYTLPQITIAAVHGAAAGLAFSVVLGCDYIIAEEESKLAMNFIGIGLVPDGAGHFFLKERVGVPQAKQIIWSGEVMTGNEAFEKGLVDEVTPVGKSEEFAEGLVHKLLTSPITSMIATKKILHDQKFAELESVLAMESETQVNMRLTEDHLEGIQAFVEKRKPQFTGK
ncbi:enoyl-CoA hydratase [Sporosarcina sp. CAU 1771]